MAADDGEKAIIAGTTIARHGLGVVIRGPSGSGKSDLALRALTTPLRLPGDNEAATFELVSDDQTEVERIDGRLIARAPASIRGLIEVRGIGIVAWPAISDVTVALVADIREGACERMPAEKDQTCQLLDVELRRIDISAGEPSAVTKLAVATRVWSDRPL